MSLFKSPISIFQKDEYSHTIEIYDSIPKYVWNQKKNIHNTSNAIIIRKAKIRGKKFLIKIKPAIIEKKSFKTILIYPGAREEIVEDALRKIAAHGGGEIIHGKAGVTFTLYELQRELIRTGHGYNLNEIKESIEVCRGSTLEYMTKDKKIFISSSFFPLIGFTKKNINKKNNLKCFVQFNPLVNQSILNYSFKLYNYTTCMNIHSPFARYMYKRMSHYWIQAHPKSPYTPSLISFLNYSPRDLSNRMSENIRAMKNTLQLLIKKK
ncbi:plasmid replication protein (plasmid) [Buchnera aphidicola (Sitobion avenae)]|uniref:Plasmid replication protein n=1 Tax=Buchnera aphidicola (Sitobion avenae) TaxID=571428 RepID=A0A4D6Y9E6_9GAMM|nr:plasmid replication protein [Buchnera aphidicola]QCI25812.1 plasmid replication protein [Buchnera aphidicola (Sitobion avenae)]